jgi:hypothetical protein
MGMIINIDEAVKLRTDFNVLREPLNKMLQDRQEAWEKENPIDLLFNRSSISTFQETYTSSIGFDHAFSETSDYAVGPIFNTAEGFSATYRTRTFQGGFIITQQTIEDGQMGRAKDDANAFIKRWHGDVVEYAMTAIDAGFGVKRTFGSDANGGKSNLILYSADTTDGSIDTATKNPLFCNTHKTVKREGGQAVSQSNMFYAEGVDIKGSDPARIAKLGDIINQAITIMENYKDDNGKFAGVVGAKSIVAPNDPHLKAAIETALSMDMFKQGESMVLNPAYKRATLATTPYLNDLNCCRGGIGFFIVDKSYNADNHGPELTERVPLTLDVIDRKEAPKGIKYEGRQRFDINVASWRGIAYVYIGTPTKTESDWNYENKFTKLTPASTVVRPVEVVNTVTTKTGA